MRVLLISLLLLLPVVVPVMAVETTVTSTPFALPSDCEDRFVTHSLPHTTTVPGGAEVRMFEANGSGAGINDLDNDGLMDIVLANHAGANTILWNSGGLEFEQATFGDGNTRAVTIIDLDADGWQDIVFSRVASAPNLWRNLGGRQFEQVLLPGVSQPLYSINWADTDQDGDLDLVGGTYDAELLTLLGTEFLDSHIAGVYAYENANATFYPERLADEAQALALLLSDIDGDGSPEILVGNDFAVPDYSWTRSENGWKELWPFNDMSHSTMSFDSADLDNDSHVELFSTDMKPYAADEVTMAAWEPVMSSMMDMPHAEGDPQVMANVLQGIDSDIAEQAGIDATGWSWSGKFGDLDQDGYLDLYVVNGMIESTIFGHLPAGELVEENQAFRNDGSGAFVTMPGWGLQASASGRGLSIADLDNDGDLDMVVNNLRAPALLFENRLCGGDSLQVALQHEGSLNRNAIGARLVLHSSIGQLSREIKAASGYLSGDPSRAHFGFPSGTTLERLEIRWPDGEISEVAAPAANALLTVHR
jgi:hypothetical protein